MRIPKNMARKTVIATVLVCSGMAALLVAQNASSTRVEQAAQQPTSRQSSGVPVRTAAATPSRASTTQEAVKYRAFLDKYCSACHNKRTANPAEGPVNFESASLDDLLASAETWERVIRKLSVRAMPPPGVP